LRFLRFCENRRPAYLGSVARRLAHPRRAWRERALAGLEYDVDSDSDWESACADDEVLASEDDGEDAAEDAAAADDDDGQEQGPSSACPARAAGIAASCAVNRRRCRSALRAARAARRCARASAQAARRSVTTVPIAHAFLPCLACLACRSHALGNV
jgi:hypothetical protein